MLGMLTFTRSRKHSGAGSQTALLLCRYAPLTTNTHHESCAALDKRQTAFAQKAQHPPVVGTPAVPPCMASSRRSHAHESAYCKVICQARQRIRAHSLHAVLSTFTLRWPTKHDKEQQYAATQHSALIPHVLRVNSTAGSCYDHHPARTMIQIVGSL